MTRILVLCTGNRCRSQMAQGILQSLDAFKGTEEDMLPEFRRVRDEIKRKMQDFYLTEIKGIKIECCSDKTCNL